MNKVIIPLVVLFIFRALLPGVPSSAQITTFGLLVIVICAYWVYLIIRNFVR